MGILIVVWVEPSAQNTFPTQLISATKSQQSWNLFCSSQHGTSTPRRGGSEVYQTQPFCGWHGWYLYHTPSPPTVIFSIPSFLMNRSSLSLSLPSLVLQTSLLKSLWFLEGFGSRECEKAREDHSSLFLCTWWSPSRLVCSLLLELGS